MSSSSPERYKSRLFNFLNRQSIRLGSEFGKTLRKLKIATEFGVQMMLFPVYLMVQAGRATRQQLEPKTQPTKYLTPGELDSDALSTQSEQPIEQILKAVEPIAIAIKSGEFLIEGSNLDDLQPSSLELAKIDRQDNLRQKITATLEIFKAKLSHQKNSPSAIAIQGVASSLDSRNLVLVDCYNQTLDILNALQQEQLSNFIVAKFGQPQPQKLSSFHKYTQKFLSALPDLSQHNPHLLPPVRGFWKVINWVQTSPIASHTNIFGESQLTNHSLAPANLSEQDLLLNKILNSVDSAVANIETQPLVKTGYLFQNLQQQWLTKRENKLNHPLNKNTRIEQSSEVFEPDPFQINVLIKAAIDHFFNHQDRTKSIQSSSAKFSDTNNLTASEQSDRLLKQSIEAEPWLSWEDIFSNLKSNHNSQIDLVPHQSEKLSPTFPKPNSITQSSQQLPQTLKVRQQKSQSIASVDATSKSTKIIVNNSASEDRQLKTAPEWLETEATTVGYVKHPLERLLEWLDLIMLWIENLWAKIWHKLKLISDKLSANS